VRLKTLLNAARSPLSAENDRLIGRAAGLSVGWLVGRSIGLSVCWGWLGCGPVGLLVGWLISRSVGLLEGGRSVLLSVCWCVILLIRESVELSVG
jgi:hypothetical protein